jgi:NADH-quinone oxidoreductase subunit F
VAEFPVDPAVSEGRVPERAPEGVPELHEVGCPDELRERIETLMSRYPDRHSVSIPALWAVQELYGWCAPEGIRQAAAVMRVTPAYLESVASFYDLLHTEPVGSHKVAVCTNISCWMRGGDELLDAFRAAAEGEDVFVSGFECLGACEIAPMASIDRRYFGPLEAGEATIAIDQLISGQDVLPEKALAMRPLTGDGERGGRRPGMPGREARDTPGFDSTEPSSESGRDLTLPESDEGRADHPEGERKMPETRVLLAHAEDPELRTLAGYRGYGGYATLEKAYREMEADAILKQLEDSGLRGRGGAGFSMGKKVSFLPRGEMRKYLCCNADESEPGAFKDRELMQRNPHQLIEGIAIAAIAADAGHAFVFIRGEYHDQADILDAAVAEAYEAGYLGENICGSRRDLELVVHRGAGAYICGEETALLDALEGKRGNPRLKPPFPAVQGLYGGPTLVNNVETLSNVPRIVAHGAEWFRGFGTEQSPGTKVVSVSGRVRRPGNFEVELGVPTRELICDLAGGPIEGEVKAFYPGGSSSPVLTGEEGLDLPYTFEDMAAAGSMLGSGSIIVADESVSIPQMALRTARFYHHESCGKCTPCREGTNWTVKVLERVVRGEATPMDLDIVASVQDNIIGHCLCVLGDSMAMPVASMVRKFREEFERTIAEAGPPLEEGARLAAVQGAPETMGASA